MAEGHCKLFSFPGGQLLTKGIAGRESLALAANPGRIVTWTRTGDSYARVLHTASLEIATASYSTAAGRITSRWFAFNELL